MDSLFDILDKECEQAKTKFACIKKHDVKGYAGSYIDINIVFTLNENIYLAEILAGKNIGEYLDQLLKSTKRHAVRSCGVSYERSNIKIKCELV